jgi:hypothetical protein
MEGQLKEPINPRIKERDGQFIDVEKIKELS